MAAQSGIYHETYPSDMQIRPTTMQRVRLLLLLVVAVGLPFVAGSGLLRIVNLVLIASVGAIGLNVLTGYTGQISLGQGAFLAIGAYACGLLMVYFQVPWVLAMIAAAFITAFIGGIFGLPSLRLKGLYLAVATLAAQQIVNWVIIRWDPIDGAIDGVATDALNIPANYLLGTGWTVDNRALYTVVLLALITVVLIGALLLIRRFLKDQLLEYAALTGLAAALIVIVLGAALVTVYRDGIDLSAFMRTNWQLNSSESAFYVLGLLVLALVVVATNNLFRTHLGRAFIAIRDQDIAAEVMGVNLFRYKVLAFAVSSFIVGLAGALVALHSTAISFERFTIQVSIEYLAMIIIGGLASISGSIYGAAFIVILPEILRQIGSQIAGADPAAIREFNRILPFAQQGAFGVVIVLTLILEPEGIVKIWRNIKDYFRLWPFSY